MLIEGQNGTVVPFNGVKVGADGIFGTLAFLIGDKWLMLGKYPSIERAEAVRDEIVRNAKYGSRRVYTLPRA